MQIDKDQITPADVENLGLKKNIPRACLDSSLGALPFCYPESLSCEHRHKNHSAERSLKYENKLQQESQHTLHCLQKPP